MFFVCFVLNKTQTIFIIPYNKALQKSGDASGNRSCNKRHLPPKDIIELD